MPEAFPIRNRDDRLRPDESEAGASDHPRSAFYSAAHSSALTPIGRHTDDANAGAQPASRDTSAPSKDRRRSRGQIQMVIRLHHLSRWLLERHLIVVARFVERLIRLVYAARIPAEAQIDPSVHFTHNALSVVITKMARIGPRCEIGVHVVLGSRWPSTGAPQLAEEVIVHAGAKIIGPVVIGRGSVIGANAVVISDIPPHSLAVGVPAVVKKSGIRIDDYFPKDKEQSDVRHRLSWAE